MIVSSELPSSAHSPPHQGRGLLYAGCRSAALETRRYFPLGVCGPHYVADAELSETLGTLAANGLRTLVYGARDLTEDQDFVIKSVESARALRNRLAVGGESPTLQLEAR